MRDRITLNRKEQTRAKVITMVIEGRGTTQEAAELLRLSRRHVMRPKERLREGGAGGVGGGPGRGENGYPGKVCGSRWTGAAMIGWKAAGSGSSWWALSTTPP